MHSYNSISPKHVIPRNTHADKCFQYYYSCKPLTLYLKTQGIKKSNHVIF